MRERERAGAHTTKGVKEREGEGGGRKGRERERGELRAIAATLMAEKQIGRNKHGTTSSVGNPLCDETGRGAKSLWTRLWARCIMVASERANFRRAD